MCCNLSARIASVSSAVFSSSLTLGLLHYSIVPPRDIDPKIGPKNRLTNAERLFEGKFTGPEAFAAYDGQLYTGVHGGYVLRIEEDDFVPIVKFGEKCGELCV